MDYAVVYSRAVRYAAGVEHSTFQKAIRKNPLDSNARAVYADWIEENDPDSAAPPNEPFHPGTLSFLRNHEGAAWAKTGGDGKVHAGRLWTLAEIRDAMNAAGSHWFDRQTMQFFRTRLHGPGGVYFVTSEQTPNSGRHFTVRSFQPAYSNFSPRIGTFEFMGHPDRRSAAEVARRLANGESVDRSSL